MNRSAVWGPAVWASGLERPTSASCTWGTGRPNDPGWDGGGVQHTLWWAYINVDNVDLNNTICITLVNPLQMLGNNYVLCSGTALLRCGEAQKQLGEAEKKFVQSTNIHFLTPLRSFTEGEYRAIQVIHQTHTQSYTHHHFECGTYLYVLDVTFSVIASLISFFVHSCSVCCL